MRYVPLFPLGMSTYDGHPGEILIVVRQSHLDEQAVTETIDGKDHLVIETIPVPPLVPLLRNLLNRRRGIRPGPHEVNDLLPDECGRQSLELRVFTDEPRPFLMPDDAIAQAILQSLATRACSSGSSISPQPSVHRGECVFNGIEVPLCRVILQGDLLLVKLVMLRP